MERIKISLNSSQTRHNPHDIETALAWNIIKKVLHETGRQELFESIKSVKVTEKYITIHTGKPIINAELLNLKGLILD